MSVLRDVVLVAAKRTPIGSFQGSLSGVSAPQLGAIVIKALVEETKLDPQLVDEVIMGNVLSAGLGQAPARQAALYAGLPKSVECLTVNKMCGSGLKSVMLAVQAIQVGDADVIIAGGMENMSQAPYLLPKARTGYRMGHGKMLDSMIADGLWDVYGDKHMGNCAEMCARKYEFTREAQDSFAIQSYQRALETQNEGGFDEEITQVEVPQRKGDPILVTQDDEPGKARFEKIPKLRAAFEKDGTITAANASKINDGASAVLVMAREKAEELGLEILASVKAQASAAQEPDWFTTAPVTAIEKALKKANMIADDIDLWEINEAFAPVAMAAIEEYKLDVNKVNVNGGAIALGHPIGASGARVLTTLLHAMNAKNVKTGLATLCIGGGEASVLIVEK